MTDHKATTKRLGALFTDCFHIEVPSADTDLLGSGILDSLQFVELLLQLEQNFDLHIKIDDINLEDLRTLERIARLIDANSSAARPSLQESASAAD